MYFYVYLAGATIMLTALSGKLFTYGVLGEIIQKNLKFLITFALGVFMATLYLLFNEARELEASLVSIALAAGFGALVLEVLQRLIPDAHHHHGSDESECCDTHECQSTHVHEEAHPHSKINPRRILLGDAVHNLADGILLVPAYLTSLSAGIALTVGILLHEFVQEVSEFFILKEAGYSTKRALISNFIVSSTILIGITLSLLVSTATTHEPLLIAFSIGSLLYIIVRDLLPHTLERVRQNGQVVGHLSMLMLGIALMLAVAFVLPG